MQSLTVRLILSVVVSVMLAFLFTNADEHISAIEKRNSKKMMRTDYFYFQRMYPFSEFPFYKYFDAMQQRTSEFQKDNNDTLTWYPVGPYNIGGRVSALVVDPGDVNTIIIGGAAGGIFKTTNGGVNWIPKTDFEPSLSIGSLVMDPTNSNIIYCGTGEGNSAIDNYPGFGVLKSTDKGETWNLVGLENALHIGKMDIYPGNTNMLFAAVMGYKSFSQDKGIYKSIDAGNSWRRVLFVSDSTSGTDVKIDPSDSNIVYAAMWERVRTPPTISKTGGVTSGMYRSSNAGETWTLLGPSNGLPAPSATTGRIAIAVSKSNPNYVYAIYKTTVGNAISAFYRSTDKGITWTQRSLTGISSSSFAWYFGLIDVDPNNFNTVYIGDIDLYKTTNGGDSWLNLTDSYSDPTFIAQHPDQHSLWINPSNPSNLVNGNDGGIFITSNGGSSWQKSFDLPLTQFYATTIDFLQPQIKLGGSQDNGTTRSLNGSLDNWQLIYGGDGFTTIVDYTNSNVIYATYQYGGIGRSTNGGNTFTYIGGGLTGRFNWSTPYTMDLQDPNTLYLGSNFIFRTTNRGNSWTQISPDLTRGPNGRLGTITCISTAIESDQRRVIYVGTDDAKVSVSTNSGTNWTDVTGSLPDRYITDIIADKRNPAVAYVSLSGFFIDQPSTHIFRTTNYGQSWVSIDGNLLDVPVNSIAIDYNRDSVLFIGSDAGVYYTRNLGGSWALLGNGLPNSPVFDLNFHEPTQKLAAGTHGRSMFEVDVSNLKLNINTINEIVNGFKLKQNFPNPFNPETTIRFSIPVASEVKLTIFDITGKEIVKLVDQRLTSGVYEQRWYAGNMPSGVYFYRIEVGSFADTKKMLLVK